MTLPTPVQPAAIAADSVLRRGTLRRMLRNPLTVASLFVLVVFVIVSIIQPWIQPFSPSHIDLSLTNVPPFQGKYILGGDIYGRDILSLIASTRGAMEATLVLATVAFLIGVGGGLIAGYVGGGLDSVLTWMFSALMAVPGIVILISLYAVLGASTSIAMTVFGILSSPTLFWVVRTLTRGVRNELYVDAARVSGLSGARIVGRHVLSAIRAPVILITAGLAGSGIAVQVGLQFLGLGTDNAVNWGEMLNDAFANIYVAPEQLIWPAATIGLVTGAFTLASIGMRDVLEGTFARPSGRQRRRQLESLRGPVAAEKTPRTSIGVTEPALGNEGTLLSIEALQIAYATGTALTTVVDKVSLTVREGEVVGLVGESGSGKTQTVFAAMGLLPDEAIVAGGSINVAGHEVLGMAPLQLARLRGTHMGYVPQEPTANLDPSFAIGAQLVYGIRAQSARSRAEARDLAVAMLDRVGIREPERVMRMYPHQISGGMAQRVLIAGAVACRPPLLIADEPTTALDVTVQSEVLDLLRDLQSERNMGVLIVTHNFGVVADLCDRVIVMRAGKIVESGLVSEVFAHPQHEYTQMLLRSVLDESEPRRTDGGPDARTAVQNALSPDNS